MSFTMEQIDKIVDDVFKKYDGDKNGILDQD